MKINNILFSCISFIFFFACNKDQIKQEDLIIPEKPDELVITNTTVFKSDSLYCAFCDLAYYNNKFYAAFRVGVNHVPFHNSQINNGYIKIMSSTDSYIWTDELEIRNDIWDLRDPCFCYNEDKNELSISYGLHDYNNPPLYKTERAILSVNNDKLTIKETNKVNVGNYSHYWLWKIYYYDNKYWSVGYYDNELPILVSSDDGIQYEKLSDIPVLGNETAITFADDKIIALSRNIQELDFAFQSSSEYPYKSWTVSNLNEMIQSPEIVQCNSRIYVAGRTKYGVSIFTYNKQNNSLELFLNLFANGSFFNIGYPGIICKDNNMYIIYYACNNFELFPSIYITKIRLD